MTTTYITTCPATAIHVSGGSTHTSVYTTISTISAVYTVTAAANLATIPLESPSSAISQRPLSTNTVYETTLITKPCPVCSEKTTVVTSVLTYLASMPITTTVRSTSSESVTISITSPLSETGSPTPFSTPTASSAPTISSFLVSSALGVPSTVPIINSISDQQIPATNALSSTPGAQNSSDQQIQATTAMSSAPAVSSTPVLSTSPVAASTPKSTSTLEITVDITSQITPSPFGVSSIPITSSSVPAAQIISDYQLQTTTALSSVEVVSSAAAASSTAPVTSLPASIVPSVIPAGFTDAATSAPPLDSSAVPASSSLAPSSAAAVLSSAATSSSSTPATSFASPVASSTLAVAISYSTIPSLYISSIAPASSTNTLVTVIPVVSSTMTSGITLFTGAADTRKPAAGLLAGAAALAMFL